MAWFSSVFRTLLKLKQLQVKKSNNQNLQADVPLSVKLKNFVQKLNDILRRLLWGTDCGGPGWCWWHLHAQHKVSSCLYEFFYRNHPFCSVQRQSWRKSVWTRVFTRRSEMNLVESIALRAPIYLEVLNARYEYFQKHMGPKDPMAMLTKGICQRNSNHWREDNFVFGQIWKFRLCTLVA